MYAGKFSCGKTRQSWEVKRLIVLLLLFGCAFYLLIWSLPSDQNKIAEYERIIQGKLDNIAAKRRQLQIFLDNFKVLDNSQEFKEKIENDGDDALSISVEENEIPVMKYVVEEVPEDKKFKRLITVNVPSGGRLGNLMFSYAALYGIALKNYMIASLDFDNVLFKYFNLSAKPILPNDMKEHWAVYTEGAPSVYINHETDRLNYETNIQLYGFFQSWKYFTGVENEIRSQFAFTRAVQNTVHNFLGEILNKFHHRNKTNSMSSNVIFVGIHIRRGDMLDWDNFDLGYTVAPPNISRPGHVILRG